MTYGWLIMLLVIGAVNLLSRLAAKKGQATAAAAGGQATEAGLWEAIRKAIERFEAPPTITLAPDRESSRSERAPSARPPRPPAKVPAPAVRSVSRAVAPGAAPQAASERRASAPTAPARSFKPARSPGRWTAARLRDAFIASEILGRPRGLLPPYGSAHEAS